MDISVQTKVPDGDSCLSFNANGYKENVCAWLGEVCGRNALCKLFGGAELPAFSFGSNQSFEQTSFRKCEACKNACRLATQNEQQGVKSLSNAC